VKIPERTEDPIKVAELEFESSAIPITIIRHAKSDEELFILVCELVQRADELPLQRIDPAFLVIEYVVAQERVYLFAVFPVYEAEAQQGF
jgi:hypothetical protein